MAIDARHLIADCREMALNVAPELRETSLYVLDADELGDLPKAGGCTLGWASQWVDSNIAERLGPRFEGPGPVIVMQTDVIGEHCTPDKFVGCFKTMFLHELAHVLPAFPEAPKISMTAISKAIDRRIMELSWKTPDPKPGDDYDPHNLAFARRTMHLLVRASALGHAIPMSNLLGGNLWQSRPEFYLSHCLKEALVMRDASFEEIGNEPLPPGLTARWESDLEFYRNMFEEKNVTT